MTLINFQKVDYIVTVVKKIGILKLINIYHLNPKNINIT